MTRQPHRIAITSGEPAGIGPDLCLQLANHDFNARLIVIGDPDLLAQRATILGLDIDIRLYDESRPEPASVPGSLLVRPVALGADCQPGTLNPANAAYVINTLDVAIDGCLSGHFDAMVTAPLHKGVINDAGMPFSGHTEYLEQRCDSPQTVMMLCAGDLRVALVTTHLPLSGVSAAITRERLQRVIRVLHRDLQQYFALPDPRILVCGLNPHAGEGGHLGREELDTIIPCLETLRKEGLDLNGPIPADTAFTPASLAEADVVLSMFHDQGLPVLKARGFGEAVNITLGLPIIRTSVDHGTALHLAGSGQAHHGSLLTALNYAVDMVDAAQQTSASSAA